MYYLMIAYIIIQYFVSVFLFLLIGRWFANFYVARMKRPDQWWGAFSATVIPSVFIITIGSIAMLLFI